MAKPADTNTRVPDVVRRAAENADRLMEANRTGQIPTGPVAPEDQPALGEQVLEQPQVPQAPQPEAPNPSAEPAPAANAPQERRPRIEPGSLEHQLEAANGRARALQRQVDEQGSRITELTNLLSTMSVAAPVESSAPAEASFESLITPEEQEQWGPDLINVIGKRAKEIVAPLEAKLKDQIERMEARVGKVGEAQVMDARARMLQTLDNRIPGWRETNQEENFLDFLSRVDDFSGQKRHDMLVQAYNSNDAARVAAFFEAYVRETSPGDQPVSQPAPAPAGVSLESLAAPGKGKSGGQPVTPEPEIITRADVTRFYADKAAGRFKGREADADAYEAKIFAAQRAGHLR